jgi:hypothetical protein
LVGRVDHLWGTKDLSKVKSDFFSLLPKGVHRSASLSTDGIVFQVKLTDMQLQNLVDSMHAKGWPLFSPQLPQPGEESKLDMTGQDVVYQAKFVQATEQ